MSSTDQNRRRFLWQGGLALAGLSLAGNRLLPRRCLVEDPQLQVLAGEGRWADRADVDRLEAQAHRAARRLGHRVSRWAVFDDPATMLQRVYGEDLDGYLRASHLVQLATARAAAAIKQESPDTRVGTIVQLGDCEPAGSSAEDHAAAVRARRFRYDWFLDPLTHGRYPQVFLDEIPYHRLDVRDGDLELLGAPLDWLGLRLQPVMRVAAARGTSFAPAFEVIGSRPGGALAVDPALDERFEIEIVARV